MNLRLQVSLRRITILGVEWHESVLNHAEVESHKYVSCRHEEVTSPRVRVFESKAVVEGGPKNDPARKIDRASLDKWKMKFVSLFL